MACIADNAWLREQLREGLFRTWHIADGEPTANILRTQISGGTPYLMSQGTAATVSGLDGLLVAVSQPGQYETRTRRGDQVRLKEGEREFMFLDIPAAGGIPADTLEATDAIEFESGIWQPLAKTIQNDTEVGISSAICTYLGPAP